MNPLLRKMPLMRTCKEVTALVVAREDHELPTTEQVAVRIHMAMCKTCPVFERQILTLRHAMWQWRNHGNGNGNDSTD